MARERFVSDLYDASYRRLVGQLTGVTGSRVEAEEAVQEAFVRALGARGIENLDNPEAWLRTVAVNHARSRWRRVRRFAGLLPDLAPDPVPTGEPDPDHLALMAALRLLPANQREAVALYHLADLSVNEIAHLLGAPAGTVKARLSRGRAALAVLLTDDIGEVSHD